jgi:hypothetical protein
MEYRFNEASVTLPAELIDRSLQTFVLADGKQSFNVVISRVDLESKETLEHLCERLLKEWQSKLPRFKVVERKSMTVDGEEAEYFDCRWSANNVIIHQRQIVTLAPNPDGSEPLNGLIITGTCHTLFSPPYTEIFEQLLLSLRWREPEGKANLPDYYFALSRADLKLRVFASAEELCSQINPFEVENELWRFYDGDGAPMKARWLEHNRKTDYSREPGRYELIGGGSWSELAPLQSRLDTMEGVEKNPYIKNLSELRRYLLGRERRKGGA